MEPAVGDLGEMRAFLEVARLQSFSAAAKALGLTSSSVSKQVARLEERLRVQLLRRTTRRVSLTEAGDLYAERAGRILADVEEAQRAVADLDGTPRGTLRISAPTILGTIRVAPAVLACRAKYPELRIDLDITDRIVDLVAERIDVAVRQAAEISPASLVARRLADDRRVLCASPRYLRRHGTPRRLEDLADHDCITHNMEPVPRWTLVGPEGERVIQVSGTLRSSDTLTLRDAAVAGIGLANLPDYVVEEHLESGALRRVLPEYGASKRAIFAVYAAPARAAVRVFVETLAKALGEGAAKKEKTAR
ncbi:MULTISPECIES: LysR family transcriptional regulator [Sorangium]|uniref:LysR family transcriptional regulator n=1 Tax=Sorangium cellulosum TaxID=56 RepID=A0A4P2QV09_SORCE|nr:MULTISPECIES: LysR family transcriptional regulator [Sorangium]AUX33988.1 LysR family transcriptional regulator [Sorangium cellulosum]WCQ93298.1 HTH-type transcriptional regulator DmlR [Sorangium sp. Soce836]